MRCKDKTKNENVQIIGNRETSTCKKCGCKKSKFIKGKKSDMKGEGIVQDVLDQVKKTSKGVKLLVSKGVEGSLREMPLEIKKLLNKYGDYKIISYKAIRHPINKMVSKAMNVATLGKLEKNKEKLGHDDLYHLFLNIGLNKDNDTKYLRLEKNQRVMSKISGGPYKLTKADQSYEVNNPPNVTLTELLQKGEKKGGKDFWIYDSISANCQKFVNAINLGNGIKDKNLSRFVLQDVDNLLSKKTSKLARKITNIAGVADILIKGGKMTRKCKK